MISLPFSFPMIQSKQEFSQLRILLALFSLLFSAYAVVTDDIINSDGILYMQMAQAFIEGGLAATALLYDWPFYSIIIAYLSQLTGLSLEISAHVLNALFFVVFTDALLLVARQLLPNLQHTFSAALLILFFYSINDYRDFIIRDIGYWAFTAVSLYYFIRFISIGKLNSALLWQLSTAISILFRIEGLILLLAMPFYVILVQARLSALNSFIKLNLLSISIFILAIVISLFIDGWITAFGKLATIMHYLNFDAFMVLFERNSNIISTEIMHPVAEADASSVLFLGLIGMVIYKIILGLSVSYILMYFLARFYKISSHHPMHMNVINYFLLINISILLVFSFKQYFITDRYAVMAMVAVFLLVLPKLSALLDKAWQSRSKPQLLIIFLLMIFALGDAAHQTNSKSYIPDTAEWAAENISAESTIYTSSEFIAYYFNKKAPNNEVVLGTSRASYEGFDYLIQVEKNNDAQPSLDTDKLLLKPVYKAENRRGDRAVVYRVETKNI